MQVNLDCGCHTDADHEMEDRVFVCSHGRHWVIHADRVVIVTYTVRETSFRRVA